MNILCFGDSNTYGYQPCVGGRYEEEERFTGILQRSLGDGWHVIEEGLNGRTANEIDEEEPFTNGRNYAIACVMSHRPVHWLVLMLGTNDVKIKYDKPICQIAESVGNLTRDMKEMLDRSQTERVNVLLIAPKALTKDADDGIMYDKESIQKSEQLGELLCRRAKEEKWKFFDAGDVDGRLGDDGVHLTPEGHKKMADKIKQFILEK